MWSNVGKIIVSVVSFIGDNCRYRLIVIIFLNYFIKTIAGYAFFTKILLIRALFTIRISFSGVHFIFSQHLKYLRFKITCYLVII